ncbi:MAG: hypothetical protein AAGI13_10145 [Pseudomonadota bacterium]
MTETPETTPHNCPADTNRYGNISAAIVVILSVLIAFGMLWLLHVQLDRINAGTQPLDPQWLAAVLSHPAAAEMDPAAMQNLVRTVLETDAQHLRSMRSQTAVGSRLTVQIVAQLIGLSLIILGGALTFARVRSETPGSTGVTGAASWSFELRSVFPGVTLCFFGAALVAWVLDISVDAGGRVNTIDGAIYVDTAPPVLPLPAPSDLIQTRFTAEQCAVIGPDHPDCKT